MMRSAIFLVLCGVVVYGKTIEEVKTCRETVAADCLKECKTKNPDVKEATWNAIKTCKDTKKTKMADCFKGVVDDKADCYAHPHKNGDKPKPKDHKEGWKPLQCIRECAGPKAEECSNGCTATPPKDGKGKNKACKKDVFTAFKTCISDAKKSA